MAFKLRSSVVTVRRLLKYFRLEAFPTQTRELIMVVVVRSDLIVVFSSGQSNSIW